MTTATKKRPAQPAVPDEAAVRCPRCWRYGVAGETCGFCHLRIPTRVHWHLFGGER